MGKAEAGLGWGQRLQGRARVGEGSVIRLCSGQSSLRLPVHPLLQREPDVPGPLHQVLLAGSVSLASMCPLLVLEASGCPAGPHGRLLWSWAVCGAIASSPEPLSSYLDKQTKAGWVTAGGLCSVQHKLRPPAWRLQMPWIRFRWSQDICFIPALACYLALHASVTHNFSSPSTEAV